MRKPPHVVEIFLQPGEYYFSDRHTRIRTVLGSCVAVTMWHPKKLIGGMCHYMLPKHGRKHARLDARYAEDAFALMLDEVRKLGTALNAYEVKLFGGGNMFPEVKRGRADHVGRKNAEIGQALVASHGAHCVASDLGGNGHRNVLFDIWSGHVWVRHIRPDSPINAVLGE